MSLFLLYLLGILTGVITPKRALWKAMRAILDRKP